VIFAAVLLARSRYGPLATRVTAVRPIVSQLSQLTTTSKRRVPSVHTVGVSRSLGGTTGSWPRP
jgi:hypothetical protein